MLITKIDVKTCKIYVYTYKYIPSITKMLSK